MDEPTQGDPGCDVCHTVVTDHEGYLRLQSDEDIYGNVCSWLCGIQLCAMKQADLQKRMASEIEDLRRKTADQPPRKGRFGYI